MSKSVTVNILGKDALRAQELKGKYLQKDEKDLEVSIHWHISSNIYLDDGQLSYINWWRRQCVMYTT
jgi:hypothetical protein